MIIPLLQKGSSYDSEFISSCLVSRLQDDDPAVVAAVVELGEKVGERERESMYNNYMYMCIYLSNNEQHVSYIILHP